MVRELNSESKAGCGARLAVVAATGMLMVLLAGTVAAASSTTLMTLTGAATGDLFGRPVSGAGDVNGDGYADVIVGGDLNDAGGFNAGRAYVFYGGPGADTVPDLTLTGEASNDVFGVSVSGAGDVNGDGYADVIVGAYHNDAGGADAGRAYVYYGGPGADAVADLTLTGQAADDQFGWSVAGAGDVNGDGNADVIVGAPHNDAGGADAGRAFVFFGGPGADAVADLTLNGAATNDLFGISVSGAGDLNGDGYADVVVGAFWNDAGGTDAGRAYVYYGGPDADAVPDITLTGQGAGDNFGWSVAGAGDVNGDGYADVIIGADLNEAFTGRAYVYYGGPGADPAPDLTLSGATPGEQFGFSVSTSGDVDRDGYADVIIGAPNAGHAYVFFGGPSADGVADLIFTGAAPSDLFGFSVSDAGDVNGDGHADVIVGAPQNDAGGTDAGRAYVFGLQSATLGAAIDLDPDVIDLASQGRWVTAYIEPVGFDPTNIDISTLRLDGSIPAERKVVIVGDHDGNNAADMMAKFSRQALVPRLVLGVNRLAVTGSLVTGEGFRGTGEVRVINQTGSSTGALALQLVSPLGEAPVMIAVGDASGADRQVSVYDVRGRLVGRWNEVSKGSGYASWDGRRDGVQVASGIYFVHIAAGGRTGTIRSVIAR